MTFEEIDQIQACPQTDALIAEKILGCNVGTDTGAFVCECKPAIHGISDTIPYQALPRFSRDLSEAWKLIHKILFQGSTDKSIRLEYIGSASIWRVEMYYCQFYVSSQSRLDGNGPSDDELPLLICRCLLKIYFYNQSTPNLERK